MILTVGIKQKIFLDRSQPIFFTVVCLCATKNRHNYLKFCAFAKKNSSFFDKPRFQRRLWHIKSRYLPNAPSQSPRIQLALNSDTDCRFQMRKHSIGGPGGLPWSPQGRGKGLRERGKLRVEKVGFPSPFCLTTLQKVEFALLFQKPIQDPSTRLRLGRGTAESSVHGRKLCAQEKALRTGKSSAHRKKLCAQ